MIEDLNLIEQDILYGCHTAKNLCISRENPDSGFIGTIYTSHAEAQEYAGFSVTKEQAKQIINKLQELVDR